MAYPFAPWIKPPENIAQEYLSGITAGAGIAKAQAELQQSAMNSALAQQRLAQEAQHNQLQMALEQQRLQRQSLIDQQRLEVTKAYHDQQLALKQQQIQETAQLHQSRIQDAIRKTTLRAQYEQRIQSGEDPMKVLRELGPSLGMGEQVMSQAFRALAPRKATSDIGKLQEDYADALKRGDQEGAQQLQEAIAKKVRESEYKPSTIAGKLEYDLRDAYRRGDFKAVQDIESEIKRRQQPKPAPRQPATMSDNFAKAEMLADVAQLKKLETDLADKLASGKGEDSRVVKDARKLVETTRAELHKKWANAEAAAAAAPETTTATTPAGRNITPPEQTLEPAPADNQTVQPAPAPGDRVVGKTYTVPKGGEMVWTAEGWVKPEDYSGKAAAASASAGDETTDEEDPWNPDGTQEEED